MKTVVFTEEELLFIEKIMDIQASLTGNQITKTIETLADTIIELGRTQLILKQIRDKIEESRK